MSRNLVPKVLEHTTTVKQIDNVFYKSFFTDKDQIRSSRVIYSNSIILSELMKHIIELVRTYFHFLRCFQHSA